MTQFTYAELVEHLMALGVPRERAEYRAAQECGVQTPSGAAENREAAAVVRPQAQGMNKTEARRAAELEAMRRAGEIRAWQYEAVTFRLAHDCRYTPDFFVEEANGALRVEETKGFWRDDARVKVRVAARMFPQFRFVGLTVIRQRDGGGWRVEEFRP